MILPMLNLMNYLTEMIYVIKKPIQEPKMLITATGKWKFDEGFFLFCSFQSINTFYKTPCRNDFSRSSFYLGYSFLACTWILGTNEIHG